MAPSRTRASRTWASRSSRWERYAVTASTGRARAGPCPGRTRCAAVDSASRRSRSRDAQVVAEPAVGVRDDRRAAAEDRVAGEQGAVGRDVERQRVAGVPRRRHDDHLETADRDDVTVAQTLVAEPVRRVERGHGRAQPPGQRARPRGVVGVAVGQQDPRHPRVADRRHDRVEVRGVVRARVDHDGQPRSRARAAPRCWCRRASSARGSPRARTPRASPTASPGPRARRHPGVRRPRSRLRSSGCRPDAVGLARRRLPAEGAPARGCGRAAGATRPSRRPRGTAPGSSGTTSTAAPAASADVGGRVPGEQGQRRRGRRQHRHPALGRRRRARRPDATTPTGRTRRRCRRRPGPPARAVMKKRVS